MAIALILLVACSDWLTAAPGDEPGADGQATERRHVDVANRDDPHQYLMYVLALPKLESLVVGGPKFTDAHARQLRRAKKLNWLVLDSTDVTDEALADLKVNLPKLQVYRSQRRAIHAISRLDPEVLVRTQVARAAEGFPAQFKSNYFREATQVDMRSVETINFRGREITDAKLEPLRHLTSLSKLDLTSTGVTDAGMSHLATLKRLQKLRCWHTSVGDAGLKHVKQLGELRLLGLGNTKVTSAGLEQLVDLEKLEHLSLGLTGVDDEALIHISKLARLKLLDLRKTKVTDEGVLQLKEMTRLEHLWVRETRVSTHGVQRLASWLPDVQLDVDVGAKR